MNGKVIGGILIGVGVIVAGIFGVKIYIEHKQDEEMYAQLEKEYKERGIDKFQEEINIYKLNHGMDETTEDKLNGNENFDMAEIDKMDLSIGDEDLLAGASA